MRLGYFLVGLVLVTGSSCILHQVNARASEVRSFGKAVPYAKLADERITESSGIAPSRRRDDVYYTHNDSGDSARVFAFDKMGKTLATINLQGVTAIDCEDMASATIGGRPTLYLGDIGDNAGKRSSITVYRFPEPDSLRGETSVKPEALELTYPDGAHNAETLLVHPATGDITIVTKTSKTDSGIYMLAAPRGPGKYTLKKVGTIGVASFISEGKLFTGGAWSPDGKHVALRTYLQGYEFAVPANGQWWTSKPVSIKTALQLQGEAITYSRDDKKLLTTSEGKPCPVDQVPILP